MNFYEVNIIACFCLVTNCFLTEIDIGRLILSFCVLWKMCSMFELISMAVMADSYKATHFQQYPEAVKMVAYGEFRTGFENDIDDTRIVIYGVRFIVEKYLHRKWTLEEIDTAEKFYK